MKVNCSTGDELRGFYTVFGYVLIGPVANVKDIKVNHQNQSSVTTTPVSLALEESYFDHFDGVVKKGCNFDWSSARLNLDGS